MKEILSNIKSPKDIKALSEEEVKVLGEEIRRFLIKSVSQTGGHLASNLGVVELTLGLFSEFDFDEDKIVWDVGHQTYVYKMLTGRMDSFNKLRSYKGLSGFPKRNESKYDFFDTGHSSTSISAALGMARARDLKGEKGHVVAVIGDGALTGGMALEALNDVGFNKTNLIIILNDNQMSISNNVGGLSSYLNKVRMEPKYNKFKEEVSSTLNNSDIGKNLANKLTKIKDSVKQLVVPSMLFEDMGIKYIGPIDGHNYNEIREVLNSAKSFKGPIIIHTVTKKGKGYEHAEDNPLKYHGISPFNAKDGKLLGGKAKDNYSKVFGNALIDIAKEDESIVAITAAMPDGTGLVSFREKFEKRFFDVGISEQHAVTLAGGMAAAGLKPVFAVYSTFLQRGLDQVLHDICIQNLPVVFAIDRAGIVGEDGETHQGVFDMSYLGMIPNMTIVAPKCLDEVKPLLKWALDKKSPVAIRYPRGGDVIESLKGKEFIEYGKFEKINYGKSKITAISSGKMLQHLILSRELLLENGVDINIVNATFIKPIDKEMLEEIAKDSDLIVTIEDHIISGGLGSNILLELQEVNYKGRFVPIGYKDKFIEQGNVNLLYKEEGLDPEGIKNTILKLLNKEK